MSWNGSILQGTLCFNCFKIAGSVACELLVAVARGRAN